MFKYENKQCPVCHEAMHEGEDIVVCPVCGTPQHRACYAKENKCAMESLHSIGFVYTGRLPGEPEPTVFPVEPAPDADTSNPKELSYSDLQSEVDGIVMNYLHVQDGNGNASAYGFKEDGPDGVSIRELLIYTVSSFTHFYKAFRNFRGDNKNKKKRFASMNWIAWLLCPVYQFMRRCYGYGLAALLASSLPGFIAVTLLRNFELDAGVRSFISVFVTFATIGIEFLISVFTDYQIYHNARRSINKARELFEDRNSEEYAEYLASHGQPSLLGAALGAVLLSIVQLSLRMYAASVGNFM